MNRVRNPQTEPLHAVSDSNKIMKDFHKNHKAKVTLRWEIYCLYFFMFYTQYLSMFEHVRQPFGLALAKRNARKNMRALKVQKKLKVSLERGLSNIHDG